MRFLIFRGVYAPCLSAKAFLRVPERLPYKIHEFLGKHVAVDGGDNVRVRVLHVRHGFIGFALLEEDDLTVYFAVFGAAMAVAANALFHKIGPQRRRHGYRVGQRGL